MQKEKSSTHHIGTKRKQMYIVTMTQSMGIRVLALTER